MAQSGKTSSNTRNYPLYILYVLKKYSDGDNPLTVTEIYEKLNEDYVSEGKADRSTVARTLIEMENAGNMIPVRLVMKAGTSRGKKFVPYSVSDGEKSRTKYYYYEQPFSEEEILTISDSVEAYNYLTVKDITDIIDNLASLCPSTYSIVKYVNNREDKLIKNPDSDAKVLANIRSLNRIIKENVYAKITYCNYGTDGKLHVRKGYPKIFKPLKLIWGNGYYYCISKNDHLETPVNLRLDRMEKIEKVTKLSPEQEKKYVVPKDLIPSKSMYRLQHPIMFGGKAENIKLIFFANDKNGMLNAMVDTFGRNIKMTPARKEDIEKIFTDPSLADRSDGEWILARVQASLRGMALFATQYSTDLRILSPAELVDEVRNRLKKAIELY